VSVSLNSDDSVAALGSEEGRGGGGGRRDRVQPWRPAAGLCAAHHLGARRGNWPPAGRPAGHIILLSPDPRHTCKRNGSDGLDSDPDR
jgi:hypothetical protein